MLKNFEVIEIKKICTPKSSPLNIIIDPKRIRFVKAIPEILGLPPYVRLLVNSKDKQFAVQVCKGNESNVFKFCKNKEESAKAVLVQNDLMIHIVRGMMPDWDSETNYIVTGTHDPKEKAIIFNLTEAVPYTRKALMADTRSAKE